MKNLFFSLFFLLTISSVYGQRTFEMVNTDKSGWENEMLNKCKDSSLNNYEFFGNFACYQGAPISLDPSLLGRDNVMALDYSKFVATADLEKGEGVSADVLATAIQPVGWGYHWLKMDPFDPQDRGTTSSIAVFKIRDLKVDKTHENLLYYDGSEGYNIPKYLFFDSRSTTSKSDKSYVSNSARAMSKSNSYSFGASFEYSGIGASANASFKKQVDEASSSDYMFAEAREEKTFGTWKITEYAILNQNFVVELANLPTSFSPGDFNSKWKPFFDKVGTHYSFATDFGAREATVRKVDAQGASKSVAKNASLGYEVKGEDPVTQFSAGFNFGFESDNKSSNESKKKSSVSKTVTVGSLSGNTAKDGAPTKVDLRPISILCRAFMKDQSEWKQREKAINDAIKYMADEHKKNNAKYVSSTPFISKAELEKTNQTPPAAKPITDLICLNKGKSDAPREARKLENDGWTLLKNSNGNAYDFNEGAGGNYIYLYYKTNGSTPITGLRAFIGDDKGDKPSGTYVKNSHNMTEICDFNDEAGGKYIYLEVIKGGSTGSITALDVTSNGSSGGLVKDGLQRTADFNKGAGGDDVFLKMVK